MERTGHKSDTFMLQVFHNENKQQNFLVTQLELSQWCSHKVISLADQLKLT